MSTLPASIVPLPQRRRGLPWVLGLGAFGLAFSLTTTSAYLPPVLEKFTDSRTLIAVILGSEGLFALTLPLVIGPWSDTFQTPMGRRRPFMLVGLGPMGFCLALVAFMPSLWLMTLILLGFFFAYYLYEPPYRGLYPDLLPQGQYGRAQGVQHLLRGVAIGVGLIGGGLLFDLWHPAPFLITAFGTVVACGAAIVFVREPPAATNRVFEGVRAYVAHSMRILRSRAGSTALPRLQLRVGGDLRGRALLRRPLHHEGAGPVRRHQHGGARDRRRRLRRGGGVRGLARRPPRARARHLLLLVRLRRRDARGGPRAAVARLVPGAHLPRRGRRRGGHDARVGRCCSS